MADSFNSTHKPWGGHESLEAAIDALRRARFRVEQTFEVSGRGLVIEGAILDGTVRSGMVLLPVLERHSNVYTPLTIQAVESVTHPGNRDGVGLVVDTNATTPGQAPLLARGTVIDVLERSPVA
jgi:hypothetical protein